MLKSKEIEILQDTVRRLGPDSYTAPWLTSVIAEVESNIRSDFKPAPTWTTRNGRTRRRSNSSIQPGKNPMKSSPAVATP
jgi:hypothetical protein